MTNRPRHTQRILRPEDTLLSSLRDDRKSPDLTRRIMGRLGYMRAAPDAAKRERRRRVIRRASWMTALLIVAAACVQIQMHRSALHGERPVPLSEAVSHDLAAQRVQVHRLFDSLRRVAPGPAAREIAEDAISPELNASARGPARWL